MQRSVWGLVSKYAGAANICFSRSCWSYWKTSGNET
jgi:hypothetical protein